MEQVGDSITSRRAAISERAREFSYPTSDFSRVYAVASRGCSTEKRRASGAARGRFIVVYSAQALIRISNLARVDPILASHRCMWEMEVCREDSKAGMRDSMNPRYRVVSLSLSWTIVAPSFC